jgi:hypothetical protein
MIKGLGRQKGYQWAFCGGVMIINFFIMFYGISTLGQKDKYGKF